MASYHHGTGKILHRIYARTLRASDSYYEIDRLEGHTEVHTHTYNEMGGSEYQIDRSMRLFEPSECEFTTKLLLTLCFLCF